MDQNSRTAQFVPAQQGTYALSLWNDNTASIDKAQMFKCVQYYNPTLKRWQDEYIPIVNPRYGYDMPILSTDRKKKSIFFFGSHDQCLYVFNRQLIDLCPLTDCFDATWCTKE